MELTIDIQNNIAIVTLECENLDAGSVKEFKAKLAPLLEEHTYMIFDLSRVKFVDSSGLGVMLSCLRKLNAKEGDLKLCGMTKQVRALFELVRMQRIFDIMNTREEAVKSFNVG